MAHATMRASDADRDRVAEVLREAYAEGRLSLEEHSDRVDQANAAKTLGELAPLLADLPQRHTSAGSVTDHGPVPKSYGPGSKVMAVFGEAKRTGRWIVEAETTAAAVFGEVTIDLRDAVLSQREVVIIANAVFGQVTIKVPQGVIVRDEGTAIFGSRNGADSSRAGSLPITAESPVVIIRGVALFGEVAVRYQKPPKPPLRDKFLGRRT
jgi:hypothetical protein